MNAIAALPTSAEKAFGEQFRALQASGPAEIGRERDYAAFSAAGLPHRRIEAWHYTDLRSTLRDVLPRGAAPEADAIERARAFVGSLGGVRSHRVVLLDGFFVPELSALSRLGDGLRIGSVLEAIRSGGLAPELLAAQGLGEHEAVVSLNGAFLQGGVLIHIQPGAKVEAPVEIVSILSGTNPQAVYTRSLIEVGDHASATIIERHVSLSAARRQGHHVLVLAMGDGSSLDHVAKVDALGTDTVHIGTTLARLGAATRLFSTTLISTEGLTRRQAYLDFVGPGSQAHFHGLSLLDGRSHADTTLVVSHTAPHCQSRELYKHILDGEATGIYQGKVIVAPGAQKTDGKMLSKAVFLADGATMFNKPELEIFADDVVCGHGATVGSLDEDQLFYLRARGIALGEAQAMLLEAFAHEAIEGVTDETLRTELAERAGQWLRRRGK